MLNDRSRLPTFLMSPSPEQALTLAKDYIFQTHLKRQICCKHADSIHLFGTCKLQSVLCAYVFLCRFPMNQLYSGEGIYVFKGCICPILPVTNTQTFWNIIKTDKTKSKTLENKGKWPCTCSFVFS